MPAPELPTGRGTSAPLASAFLKRLRKSLHGVAAAAALALAQPWGAQAESPKPADPHAPAAAPAVDRPQIVGGSLVSRARWRDNFRWIVSLQHNGQHRCGASLIARRYVLTAAHCVEDVPFFELSVLLNTPDATSGGIRIPVVGIILHPDYRYLRPNGFSGTALDMDFAVLRLNTSAPSSLPLAVLGSTADITGGPELNGLRGFALGWGATSEGGPGSARMLQVQVPVLSRSACQTRYDGIFRITANMLCAGTASGGRDSCQGDSGGPFTQQDSEGRWIQMGVTSFGEGCARPNRPGVYARVSVAQEWIGQASSRRGAACYRGNWPTQMRRPPLYDCFTMVAADDASLGPLPLGFTFRMGNQDFNTTVLNVNGSLSFGGPIPGFIPRPLDQLPFPVIAGFLDDIDTTRNRGRIYFGQTTIDGRPAAMVIWMEVSFFGAPPGAFTNTFQIVIIQRSDTEVDIELNYAGIRWNRNGARVGVGLGPGQPSREVPGSGGDRATTLLDGSPTALISNSNIGVPGRFRFRLVNGSFSTGG